jgi:tetratricopeptide (TPR) repeat protein
MRQALAVFGLALAAPHAVAAPPASAVAPVDIAIEGAGRERAHVASDPLRLTVRIFSPAARAAASENLRRFPEGERQRVPLQSQTAATVRPLAFGSEARALADDVRFAVFDDKGGPIPLAVRPLASTAALRGPARLDQWRGLRLQFGVDPAALGTLKPGRYTIRAEVEIESDPDARSGRRASRSLTLVLTTEATGNPAAAARRLDLTGQFCLFDHQFTKAEAAAREMLRLDAAAAPGWILLGDALDAQGRRDEALGSFFKALDIAAQHPPNAVEEPPAYIERRIAEIQATRGGVR